MRYRARRGTRCRAWRGMPPRRVSRGRRRPGRRVVHVARSLGHRRGHVERASLHARPRDAVEGVDARGHADAQRGEGLVRLVEQVGLGGRLVLVARGRCRRVRVLRRRRVPEPLARARRELSRETGPGDPPPLAMPPEEQQACRSAQSARRAAARELRFVPRRVRAARALHSSRASRARAAPRGCDERRMSPSAGSAHVASCSMHSELLATWA